jgi:hypothetical protein
LKYFGTLGQDPLSRASVDGMPLMIESAFDFAPAVNNLDSPRLPGAVVPGMNSPAAMGYRVPLAQLDEFRFVPEISGDLQTWFDAVTHPGYFLITSGMTGDEQQFAVERGGAGQEATPRYSSHCESGGSEAQAEILRP